MDIDIDMYWDRDMDMDMDMDIEKDMDMDLDKDIDIDLDMEIFFPILHYETMVLKKKNKKTKQFSLCQFFRHLLLHCLEFIFKQGSHMQSSLAFFR
jgi:hypothetical protein